MRITAKLISLVLAGALAATMLTGCGGDSMKKIIKKVEKDYTVAVDEYVIYGTHLNISGSVEFPYNPQSVSLVLLDSEQEYALDVDITNKDGAVTFTSGKLINSGICLETLPQGEFIVLMRCDYYDETFYYSLFNNTGYGDLQYYTLSHDGENNKIDLQFCEYELSKRKETYLPYLALNIVPCNLPDDVYDFVLDAGHGGDDPGAVGTLDGVEYYEKDFNLQLCVRIAQLLEEQGYKVALVTDRDEDPDAYNTGGRAVLANDAMAKYFFSVHNNASTDARYYGVEIYSPYNAEYVLAQYIAENVVEAAGSKFSDNPQWNRGRGVFIRTFSAADIASTQQEADAGGFEMYDNITTSTNYYFAVREVGGISTGAYVDGRDPDHGTNPYWNSNCTAEGYLLELAYLSNTIDLTNLVSNTDAYADGVVNGMLAYIDTLYAGE